MNRSFRAVLLILVLGLAISSKGQPISKVLLDTLSFPSGTKLFGLKAHDRFGFSVSRAGDINNDNYGDLIIGGIEGGTPLKGITYVVFGDSNLGNNVNLNLLDGKNGFSFTGNQSFIGYDVSTAGDFNNDGYDDILIAAYEYGGYAFVIFGRDSFPPYLLIDSLDGSYGFSISAGHKAGFARSVCGVGDINGDGFDDIAVSDISTPGNDGAGDVYIMFGHGGAQFNYNVDNLDGVSGFIVRNDLDKEAIGREINPAGDVNNDGMPDFIISHETAIDPSTQSYGSGRAYVVFGSKTYPAILELSALAPGVGIIIHGGQVFGQLGVSAKGAGDTNGDGIDDLIIGANYARDTPTDTTEGISYLLFGGSLFYNNIDVATLNTSKGVKMPGVNKHDRSGFSVSAAGDFDGDGFGDVLIGAPSGIGNPGESYLVYGRSSWGTFKFELSTLDGISGITYYGPQVGDRAGYSVSNAGDVNNDGFDDFLIGSPRTGNQPGAVYLLYGRARCGGALGDTLELSECDSIQVNDLRYFQSGEYLQILKNRFGCDSTLLLKLSILPSPDTSLTLIGNTLISNQSHAKYRWVDCKTGTGNSVDTLQAFTPTINGSYSVILFNGVCFDTSVCVTISHLSISSDKERKMISVFPNPFHTHLTIELKDDVSGEVEVFDLLGQSVFKQIILQSTDKISYDLRHLPSGFYQLRFTSFTGLPIVVKLQKM